MAVSQEMLAKHEHALRRRHPELAEATVRPLCEAGLSYESLADFLQEHWRAYYGAEAHIAFSSEFLRLVLGPIESARTSYTAWCGDALVAVILGADVALCGAENRLWRGTLTTGLTTASAHRGKGYSQFVYLRYLNALIAAGMQFSLGWLDADRTQSGTSYRVHTADDALTEAVSLRRVYGKALNLRQAGWRAGLGHRKRSIVRVANALFPVREMPGTDPSSLVPRSAGVSPAFPARARTVRVSRGYEVAEARGHEEACGRLVAEIEGAAPLRRETLVGDLSRWLAFRGEGMEGVGRVLLKSGEVLAFAYGYTNPISDGAHYLSLDGVFLHPRLGYRAKRAFLAFLAAEARDRYDCCGIIAIQGACAEPLAKYGYLPFAHTVLGAISLTPELAISPEMLEPLRVELR